MGRVWTCSSGGHWKAQPWLTLDKPSDSGVFLRIPKQRYLKWMKKTTVKEKELNHHQGIFAAFPKNGLKLWSSLVCHCPDVFSERVWINSRLVHGIGFPFDLFLSFRVLIFSGPLSSHFYWFIASPCLLSVDPNLVLSHCEVGCLHLLQR